MKKGWINDPNGLVHYDGTYHMFCQHYPDDIKWGPMHWSHATSPDMVIRYDIGSQTLGVLDREHEWPLEPDGTLTLRLLFDVNCVELFGPRGLKVMSSIYLPEALKNLDEDQPKLSLRVTGGSLHVEQVTAYPMKSIWTNAG